MNFYPILKAVSMVATGLFGVLGVLTNYKDKEGKVTKWGKVAITGILFSATISLVLYGLESVKATKGAVEAKKQYDETKKKLDTALEDSSRLMSLQRISLDKSQALEERLKATAYDLGTVNTVSHQISSRQAALFVAQTKLLKTEDQLRLWQLRDHFRLEPLTIYFEREYSMDDPALAADTEKIEEKITVPAGEISMLQFDQDFLLSAYSQLSKDSTLFRFSAANEERIDFACIPSSEKGEVWRSLVERSTPGENIGLKADFAKRTITQRVYCENPGRAGDLISISAIDLIGRMLEWRDSRDDWWSYRPSKKSPGRITVIRLNLSYDLVWQTWLEWDSSPRDIRPNKGQERVKIRAEHLGLSGVLKGLPLVRENAGIPPP
jgi:hypothetical protein